MAKLKVDLHAVFNKSGKIDEALETIVREAMEKRVSMVEIIHGKGTGQLKKRVLRFLEQKHIKELYFRIHKDRDNYGRIFVEFRHKD